jgi:hypothetical protein
MRALLYFSVLLGITFLTLRFIGLFLDLTYNDLFLALGLFLLLGVGLPLYLFDQYRYRQKMNEIIRDHQIKGSKTKASEKKPDSSEKKIQEYPSFRNQKQGLKWGGGNIHGSTASRGSKRGFLKK